jgi:hypothetical protein
MSNSTIQFLPTNCGPLGKTFRAAYCSVIFTMPFGLSVSDAEWNLAKSSPNCPLNLELTAAPFCGFLFRTLWRFSRSIDNRFAKLRQIELLALQMRFQSPANWHDSKPIANFKMMHYQSPLPKGLIEILDQVFGVLESDR